MRVIKQGPMDPAITLRSHEALEGCRVIRGGSYYGRILFTEVDPCVVVDAGAVMVGIRNCVFEYGPVGVRL